MSQKSNLFLMMLLFFGLAGTTVFAGTTGKLSGTITDAATGEPLPGTNVLIVGTSRGSAAGTQGTYSVLNIPPGTYDVRFEFIGYQPKLVTGVEINVDFTTRLDQTLQEGSIALGEVVVEAERNPIVREDLTNTQVAISSETIQDLPIEDLSEVIRLQAGIVEDNDGALHIRGGRTNDIAFQINGISVSNPFSNEQGVGIATNAVQEVSVSSGTFSAEFGNALSGVVNYVTKSGGEKLNATLRGYTGDHVSGKDDIFFNIDDHDVFNNVRLESTLGGPVPGTRGKLKFFSSAVYERDNGYLYGMDLYRPEDILFIDGELFLLDPFGDQLPSGSGKIMPMSVRRSNNITTKLTYNLTPKFRLSYDLIYNYGYRPSSRQFRNFRFNPLGRRFLTTKDASHSVALTHAVSQNTFYTLKFGLNKTDAMNYVYENPFDARYQPSFAGDVGNNAFPQTTYYAGGHNLGRGVDATNSYIGKLDVTSQVTPIHEVRFGGEIAQHELERESYTLLYTEQQFINGQPPIIPKPEINPEFTAYQNYLRKPLQGALYFLDKMELASSFILNMGLRYEYFYTNANYNPDLIGTVDSGVDQNLQKASAKHSLAPRISLSFPITDQGIIRFSYGHFYQNPQFSRLYTNPRFEDLEFLDTPTFGNPNLEPEQSIQYEVGLQQAFSEDVKIDLTVFYKDVSNLLQSRRIVAGQVAASKDFNVYTNVSYATVKGFTASLLKRPARDGIFAASLDYTYQIAEGAYDDPLNFFVDTRSGRQSEQAFIPLDHDRRHVLNATVTLSEPNDWSFSMIGGYWSGTPYTPILPSNLSPVQYENNSARRPAILNLDLRLEKKLQIGSLSYSLFIQAKNLLDLDNERYVYESTGRSLTALEETTNPTRFDNLYNIIERERDLPEEQRIMFPVRFLDDYYQREDFLSEPREIRAGFTFSTISSKQAETGTSNLIKGLKVGGNQTNFDYQGTTEYDALTTFSFGGFLGYRINDYLYIQPEFLYSQKGASFEGTENGEPVKSTAHFNYVDIPVLFKSYVLSPAARFRPYGLAGASASSLLSAETETEFFGETITEDIKSEIQNTDFGLVLGGGIEIPLDRGNLMFEARTTIGLRPIMVLDQSLQTRNEMISFLIGFGF